MLSYEKDMRRPKLARDTVWLASSDGLAIVLGLIGQVILAKALLQSDYGLLVVILDAFATMYILIDAGLPTILARDVPRVPGASKKAVRRVLKLQTMIALPFILISAITSSMIWDDVPATLLLACGVVALGHIMSYPHRSMLRALGEARIESILKLVERIVTTGLYYVFFIKGYESPTIYAFGFSIGVFISLIGILVVGERLARDDGSDLPPDWNSNKSLFIAALPFAITLGILPYVTRLEKFLLAGLSSYDDVSLYHVAQLAWIAGLMLPQAMRSALLPYLGEARDKPKLFSKRMLIAHHWTLVLLPVGLVAGHLIVSLSIPRFFDSDYSQAVEVFDILLAGWAMTLLSIPWYVALQAGHNPWRFTILISLVVVAAALSGWMLIPEYGVMGAAWASLIGCSFMLSFSKLLCEDDEKMTDGLALFCVATCYLLSIGSPMALIGILTLIPAKNSIDFLRSQDYSSEEE
jgi:O-antigen/teichoic acid export membrane protein